MRWLNIACLHACLWVFIWLARLVSPWPDLWQALCQSFWQGTLGTATTKASRPVHILPYVVPIDRRSGHSFIGTEKEMEKLIERGRWLRENVGPQEITWDFNMLGDREDNYTYFHFADESHAMAFKLVWGEE